MAYSNGALPKKVLAPITKAVNGEQAYLRKDAAKAFMAMNAESEKKFGVTLRVSSARTAYRSRVDQDYFWHLYQSGKGNLAAVPGTSNHGLGLAFDLATQQMRDIVDKIGEKYGFAKKWSDAQNEWWHIKWRPGNYAAVKAFKVNPTLKRGQTGPSVVRLKKLLYSKGLRKFGSRYVPFFNKTTQDTVKRFQKAHNLKADGVVGESTWNKLGA